jgi:hypothetical protein
VRCLHVSSDFYTCACEEASLSSDNLCCVGMVYGIRMVYDVWCMMYGVCMVNVLSMMYDVSFFSLLSFLLFSFLLFLCVYKTRQDKTIP